MPATTLMWFRRDLRLADNPALVAASRAAGPGGTVVAVFCLDRRLHSAAGAPRRVFLGRCLRALDESIGGHLVVRAGEPCLRDGRVRARDRRNRRVRSSRLRSLRRRRDRAVEAALGRAGLRFERVGSPYAVAPGTLRTTNGAPFKLFTPFARAWRRHAWDAPLPAPNAAYASGVAREELPVDPPLDAAIPDAGERSAMRAFRRFRDAHLDAYDTERNLPGVDRTSRLSPHLKFGTIHPRQLLAELRATKAHTTFANELCWREFYADVLHHRPASAHRALDERMTSLETDAGAIADEQFDAWTAGRTGYPLVDAGMRQLLAEAWMHNRVRMVVASFLVKDLHIDWRRGSQHFMAHLVDGDLASNQHGWQWCAGTGTDPAPFFRIFNPTLQGERFDPDGTYVRRWVPELRTVPDPYVHRPWDDPSGRCRGYVDPIVDHAAERLEALRRFNALPARA